MTETIRGEMLDQARVLTEGDRNDMYRDPLLNHQQIADVWSALLGVPVEPHQAAIMMAALKSCRLWHAPKHIDSAVDGAAYMAIAGECGQRQ